MMVWQFVRLLFWPGLYQLSSSAVDRGKMVANGDVIYMLEKAYIEQPQEKETKEVKKIGVRNYQYR